MDLGLAGKHALVTGARAALIDWIAQLAEQEAPHGVRADAVPPGPVTGQNVVVDGGFTLRIGY